MKHTDLKQFLALQSALVAERERIQARLAEVNRVLGDGPARAAVSSDRRKFSAATRAKMAAAQKARWAKRSADGATKSKAKRRLSAAGRAAIIAAAKARWARQRAQKTPTSG